MKLRNQKYMAAAMAACILAGSGFAIDVRAASDADYTKKENIYVTLDAEGRDKGTYVVNNFHIVQKGEITDYGDYDKVENLTDLSEIKSDGEEHTFTAEEGVFYYRGDMENKELPWLFEIQYLLDGDKIKPEEAAGAEGDLELRIHIEPNPQADDGIFAQTYMVQVSVTLDSGICKNIRADQATIIDAGMNQQISFRVLPGSSADFSVQTEVENFEMDSISISGAQAVTEQPDDKDPSINVPIEVPSFISGENKDTEQVMFMVTAQGVDIPEQETAGETVKEKTFVQKLKELLNSLLG